MQFDRAALAVNCHGWEDFPVHCRGSEAAELLACWSCLWHPNWLASAQQLPSWHRIDDAVADSDNMLLLLPSFLKDSLAAEQRNQIVDRGGLVVVGNTDRDALQQQIVEAANSAAIPFAADTIADCHALGYVYLQIQLMTRQLRYSSSLDESKFFQRLIKAIELAQPDTSATAGDVAEIPPASAAYQDAMQACFDLLLEERQRYYPTDALIIDYVVTGPETLGRSFSSALAQPNAWNLQISGETLDRLALRSDVLDLLKMAIDEDRICLVGGEYFELENALLSTTSWIEQLRWGHEAFRRKLGRIPDVYGRRRDGLSPMLPALLGQFGQKLAVHATLDDGVYPQTAANNIRWEGDDGSTIDALAAPAWLASSADSYLDLGIKIGENLDANHLGTIFLVHWPGPTGPQYQDLVRSSRFGAVLGQFTRLDEYFEHCGDPGYSQNYRADDYRNHYLDQMVAQNTPNPISRYIDYWQGQGRRLTLAGLGAMAGMLSKTVDQKNAIQCQASAAADPVQDASAHSELDRQAIDSVAAELAECLTQPTANTSGILVINPISFPQRVTVATGASATDQTVEVPALGFAWSTDSPTNPQRSRKKSPLLVDDHFIRNEFFEAEIDTATGGIRGIQRYRQRGNLLGQQLAKRTADRRVSRRGTPRGVYSDMLLDQLDVTKNTTHEGIIVTRGRLVAAESGTGDSQSTSGEAVHEWGKFQQTFRMQRGNPMLQLDIQLLPSRMPDGEPWHDYFCSRFAWDDEGAQIFNYVNESRHPMRCRKLNAPLVIDIDQHRCSTSIITGGLPFHQRVGYRRLDSILMVRGETCRHFRMGVGVDLNRPLSEGFKQLCPPILLPLQGVAPRSGEKGWLFHLNCKNVMAIDWSWPESGPDDGQPTHPTRLRVLIKETEGREARGLKLDTIQPLREATRMDLAGNQLEPLAVDGSSCRLPLGGHELACVELVWQSGEG